MRSVISILILLVYSAALAAPMPAVNSELPGCADGKIMKQSSGVWSCESETAGGVAAGLITFVITGTCPSGWTEVAALNGKAIYGTVAANADVGGAVGSDTITPTVNSLTAAAQTVNSLTAAAQTFTGNSTTVPALAAGTLATAWPAGVPTFAGTPFSGIINHTHPITDPGHTHVITELRNATTGGATTNIALTADTTSTLGTKVTGSGTTGVTTSNPAGGVASITPAGTVAWPAGVPTISGSTATGSLTPLGSNAASAVTGTMNSSAVTGTLNSFNNRPAGIKAIFCQKD